MVRGRLAVSQGGTLCIKLGTHNNMYLRMQHYCLPGILPVALPSSGSALWCLLCLTEWQKCSLSDGASNTCLLIMVLASIRLRKMIVSVLLNSLMFLQTIYLFKQSVWGRSLLSRIAPKLPSQISQLVFVRKCLHLDSLWPEPTAAWQ